MDQTKQDPSQQMDELRTEWRYLRTARTALEWLVIAAIVAALGYSIWPYFMH